MNGGYCYRDVLPFTAMVTMECTSVGLTTLFKAATLTGMSYHVFVVYAYAVAAIVLFPAPFISQRSKELPPLNFSILSKIGLLGLIGYSYFTHAAMMIYKANPLFLLDQSSSQIMGYAGINFSSPTLASALSSLVPAFTFILAIIFRMEKMDSRSSSSLAKVLGTMVSISGAFVVTLYKGPPIIITRSSSLPLHPPISSLKSNWVIGGLLLTADNILLPLWYIVQAQIMKEYPNELTVIFFYNLCVSIIAIVVGLITEEDPNAWRLEPNIALASVVCSGLFGSFLNNAVHTWALRVKGPHYVAMFKPLSIAIAVAMGFMFLGDTLHLGSLVGATIISIGFYTVIWGKSREDMGEDSGVRSLESPSSRQKVPLLQSYKTVSGREKMQAIV